MADGLRVYLDHHIPRLNLRYKRPEDDELGGTKEQPENLPMDALDQDKFRGDNLRKPDFQRATNAWTAQDCVSLLESVVNRQVIPSIIMWHSEEGGHDFILDGAHRVSVVKAWLRDEWGDKLPEDVRSMMDKERISEIREAAQEVRELADEKIGTIDSYKEASDRFLSIADVEGPSPKEVMKPEEYNRARFYIDFQRSGMKFYVQWVHGDYQTAERSFIRINKSGRELSDWEITLIENRDSSFARAVMSLTSPDSTPHYWPASINGHSRSSPIPEQVKAIVSGLESLNERILQPQFRSEDFQLRLPLMTFFGQDADKRPYWIAELLTVLQKRPGTESDTLKLLESDRSVSPENLVANGRRLVESSLGGLDHLVGNTPLSLGIVPALYFSRDVFGTSEACFTASCTPHSAPYGPSE